MVEWFGFSVDYAFLKGTLEKLDIQHKFFMRVNLKALQNLFGQIK
jgi:hypothetical protein